MIKNSDLTWYPNIPFLIKTQSEYSGIKSGGFSDYCTVEWADR